LQLRDRFIPRQRLGAGGFATIYTVWDAQRQIEQVLKVLTNPAPKALDLFTQEAIVLRSLTHRGIPRVDADGFFEIPTPDLTLYGLVMEKINGQTLETLLLDQYPEGCPEPLVLDWFGQAVRILRLLHGRQIIHRDLKPSNLMIRAETGQLVIIDFGGAKQVGAATASTRLFSTGYSPPEQVVGAAVDPRADIYALGRTLLHLLTGQPPEAWPETPQGTLQWSSRWPISPPVALLLNRMIAPNPADRPPSLTSVQQQLKRLRPAPWRQRWQTQWQRWRQAWRGFQRRVLEPLGAAVRQSIEQCIGAMLGAIAGSQMGYWGGRIEAIGPRAAAALTQWLQAQLPGVMVEVDGTMWVFALAGLGTGFGVAWAGVGRYGPGWVGLLGLLSYGLGWLFWLGMPFGVWVRLGVLVSVAVGLLVLSLGVQRGAVAAAVLAVLAVGLGVGLVSWGFGMTAADWSVILSFKDAIAAYGFCALVAGLLSLGVSGAVYAIAPLGQWWMRSRHRQKSP
jgi:hypothetical protein